MYFLKVLIVLQLTQMAGNIFQLSIILLQKIPNIQYKYFLGQYQVMSPSIPASSRLIYRPIAGKIIQD